MPQPNNRPINTALVQVEKIEGLLLCARSEVAKIQRGTDAQEIARLTMARALKTLQEQELTELRKAFE